MIDFNIKNLNIELIVFDFDGVMTDNRVLVDEDGKEAVFVSRADGMGVSIIRSKQIPMIILSTEQNKVVAQRGRKLKLEVIQDVMDKQNALKEYCCKNQIELDKVIYVGNDINDYEAMNIVGIKVVPADAHECVKHIADIVLKSKGGFGVVRELADLLG